MLAGAELSAYFLAWAKRRTRGGWPRAKMMARHQGWRNVSERLPAGGAKIRAYLFGLDPTASCFTVNVGTLKSRTRHKRHFSPSRTDQLKIGFELPFNGKDCKKKHSHCILALEEKLVNGKTINCKTFI